MPCRAVPCQRRGKEEAQRRKRTDSRKRNGHWLLLSGAHGSLVHRGVDVPSGRVRGKQTAVLAEGLLLGCSDSLQLQLVDDRLCRLPIRPSPRLPLPRPSAGVGCVSVSPLLLLLLLLLKLLKLLNVSPRSRRLECGPHLLATLPVREWPEVGLLSFAYCLLPSRWT